MKKTIPILVAIIATITTQAQSLLPMPEWADAPAFLCGQIIGYEDSLKWRIEIVPSPVYDSRAEAVRPKINADGTFETIIPMSATHEGIYARIGNWRGIIIFESGDTTTVTLDLPKLRKEYPTEKIMAEFMPDVECPLRFAGPFAELNNELSTYSARKQIWHYYPVFNRRKHTPEEYRTAVLEWMRNDLGTIDSLPFSPQTKVFLQLNAQTDASRALVNPEPLVEAPTHSSFNTLRHLGREYISNAILPETNSLLTAYTGHLGELAAGFRNIMQSDTIWAVKASEELQELSQNGLPKEEIQRIAAQKAFDFAFECLGGSQGGIQDGIIATQFLETIVQKAPLTDIKLAELQQVTNPHIRNYFLRLNEKILRENTLAQAEAKATMHDTPQSDGDQFLAEITRQFAGSVILIDLWGTWCAPCRQAFNDFEPSHDRLTDKGLITIYITDQQSPEPDWRNLSATMHGHHYRLTCAQSADIFRRHSLSGWPSYLIIDKQGRLIYSRTALHEKEMVDAIEKALAE